MKKIMFNDKFGLTQAVLDGRKTMTRRIVSEKLLDRWTDYDDFCNSVSVENIPTERQFYDEKDFLLNNAPYKLGEVIAIAQSYSDCGNMPDYGLDEDGYPIMPKRSGFFNKMFVKADLMPHHIEITGIKVERLQDISDEDCLKEGIREYFKNCGYGNSMQRIVFGYVEDKGIKQQPFDTDSPKDTFAMLIDRINGYGTWESNPFVFAYEFVLFD